MWRWPKPFWPSWPLSLCSCRPQRRRTMTPTTPRPPPCPPPSFPPLQLHRYSQSEALRHRNLRSSSHCRILLSLLCVMNFECIFWLLQTEYDAADEDKKKSILPIVLVVAIASLSMASLSGDSPVRAMAWKGPSSTPRAGSEEDHGSEVSQRRRAWR
jgi:hypothetical protein